MAILLLVAAFFGIAPQPSTRSYEAGQVWEYATRPQDAGSLARIQQIETLGGQTIYHVSLVGLTLAGQRDQPAAHLPVSQATLDASLTRLSSAHREWPDPAQGIAQWREAQGGVFDIGLREIAAILDRALSEQGPQQ